MRAEQVTPRYSQTITFLASFTVPLPCQIHFKGVVSGGTDSHTHYAHSRIYRDGTPPRRRLPASPPAATLMHSERERAEANRAFGPDQCPRLTAAQ